MIAKPKYEDAPPYCAYYFDLLEEADMMLALKNSALQVEELFGAIPAERELFRYAETKWTIRQVLRHIIDCERVYTYRAMRFSRGDKQSLPGFNENDYAAADNSQEVALPVLLEEFRHVQESTRLLFAGMTTDMLDEKGNANGYVQTARACGWMAAGHRLHHCKIIKERY
jgi:uncharacterized damage-inducible protein DinB